MGFVLLRKMPSSRLLPTLLSLLHRSRLSSSRALRSLGENDKAESVNTRLHLSPLFQRHDKCSVKDCKIEVVDNETWQVSSGLADSWRSSEKKNTPERKSFFDDQSNDAVNEAADIIFSNKGEPDFDEVEDMRIHGKLFYKLDKDSKEYEEYKFDYHGRKPAKDVKDSKKNKKKEIQSNMSSPKPQKPSEEEVREIKKNKEQKEALLGLVSYKDLVPQLQETGERKKQRTPTFNQLTAPYHEPFCLDIYISKGSVRASIIHRETSKVVAVSHSISKDMKFDLSSTKNRSACLAVGEVLAQRALADDIHNVVYTPRRGEKLEGKLQIVLKSIIDGGVNVKVKLKQKKFQKGRGFSLKTQD